MTKLAGGDIFSPVRSALAGVAVAMALFQLSACTSTDTQIVDTSSPSGLSSGQARNTGTFPNLNIPPQSAASQISDAEKAEKLSELKSAQSSQEAEGGAVPSDEELLKKLAATHAQKTLSEIEGK
ncbi:hypothetical protein [Pseudaminobacter salicylatoxidans]|uniref:hypothetical protein n=1 Tax=Pseudaminobacter salicylatoxidans TaxID=93369 RepID=UPI00036D6B50|nr:hypothetical protein [Pseudaminobacter salicylatoxidans]